MWQPFSHTFVTVIIQSSEVLRRKMGGMTVHAGSQADTHLCNKSTWIGAASPDLGKSSATDRKQQVDALELKNEAPNRQADRVRVSQTGNKLV